MTKDEYNNVDDTKYLTSIPGMKEKIIQGMQTPLQECVAEEQIVPSDYEK